MGLWHNPFHPASACCAATTRRRALRLRRDALSQLHKGSKPRMWKPAFWAAAAGLVLTPSAHADDTPDPNDHPDSTWSSRALAGYSKTGGTTDNSSANALLHIAHVMGPWKVLFGLEGLYGSTRGETT